MKTILVLAAFALVVLAGEAKKLRKLKNPNWSPVYTVKGTLFIPYAEISEPFYAWYDAPAKQSRIDYYGGMVKTYQLGTSGGFGTSLKIAPVTTETELNSNTCLQVNGTEEYSIEPQAILPSLTGFECVGEEIIDGTATEKWVMTEKIGQKSNKYTMWMKWKNDQNNQDIKYAVPVRYEMKGYNTLLGSHYDHYYLEYDYYDINNIDPNTFEVDQGMKCSAFPGPGDRHIYTFNPMKEFIHPATTTHVDFEYKKFVNKHGKQYSNMEHFKRKEVFRQNIRYIHAHNRQRKSFTMSVNHLADRTPVELKALRGRINSGGYNGGDKFPYTNIKADQLPTQFDWRIYGAVTPVKDQSVCGSCWSFGTIGAIEGAYFLKNGGNLVRLSQQALVDCSWGYGNNGCDGGEDFRAYQWMLKHGGVPTEEEYGPYLGQDGYCHVNNVTLTAKITGYVNVTSGDENALKLALLKHGPISVAIDASPRSFSFYSNGVYYEPKCGNKLDELDHAVLAVGYGSINGKDYWLVKNSWSNYWGNDGYILMSAENNNCGVMTTPTYVTM
ncbi:PREDICTED: digestive cysteine proteinase 1 [Nicrophorus vespilloides]|uniref:Digestive cysteine proteinase 1 n=1 Tax=Nicrophorus vespilloides TaxID=110193 RepID=A0ABM1MSB0_NICVS|nr:PREDICTED: digestive cysteine proteinase 1 [Nicrophorus vespilloides]